MKPETAARVAESWYRIAGEVGDPGGCRELDPVALADGERLRVDVVGMPDLAAALAELAAPAWDVRAVDTDRAVSARADAVVVHAPRASRVTTIRAAAVRARLVATFRGPAPGPAREVALRAGVDACVQGSSAAVVATYLGHLCGRPVERDAPDGIGEPASPAAASPSSSATVAR
ncbi:hypothetical protein LQ327_20790 [Actinomycetospora endophytica]|uniref:Uncharacterized protein n=1 Tax=Actinomycetospora endophytica TaxID=2291215 RepID=A0ABS8PC60_9PSEU|nr:hypothetical protein [Actinomycetospora endophytica]MCD2195813.1 hypothetical protein [Actinomycetospora endophytica]